MRRTSRGIIIIRLIAAPAAVVSTSPREAEILLSENSCSSLEISLVIAFLG
jgi:DNA-binding CsgD family transcriptional regulator